jgi:hypothetical protein
LPIRTRTWIMTILMSITLITITAGLSGYYYLRSQSYLERVQEYESSYPSLLQKYTDLLENYNNSINLLENYNNLIEKYGNISQNHTELWKEYEDLIEEYGAISQNYTKLREEYESVTVLLKLCINYGNGTMVWYNGSRIPINTNLLNATMRVANVQYTYWPALEASFVDAINGVSNSPPYYWMWLYQDVNTTTWTYGPSGADLFIVKSGQVFMWRYEIPTY